ncbi:hypothetical protein JCM11602_21340 [Thermus brockianus]|jgi:uncharacterized protein (UPF0332 family)
MPSPEQHRRQARHNEGVASKLEAIAIDWAITAYFYTAAHLARAYLAEKGYSFKNHGEVDNHLKEMVKKGSLRQEAYEAYVNLYRNGRRARYDCELPEDLKEVLDQTKLDLQTFKAAVPQ